MLVFRLIVAYWYADGMLIKNTGRSRMLGMQRGHGLDSGHSSLDCFNVLFLKNFPHFVWNFFSFPLKIFPLFPKICSSWIDLPHHVELFVLIAFQESFWTINVPLASTFKINTKKTFWNNCFVCQVGYGKHIAVYNIYWNMIFL